MPTPRSSTTRGAQRLTVDTLAADPADLVTAHLGADDEVRAHVARLIARPEWHDLAECRGEPIATFFPPKGASTRPALTLCGRCEVRQQCLDDALADPALDHGIRGGMTANARKAHRRAEQARERKRGAS